MSRALTGNPRLSPRSVRSNSKVSLPQPPELRQSWSDNFMHWTSGGSLPRVRRQRSGSIYEPTFTTNPHHIMSDRVVIAMVGLPARGKSYISKAIVRYLSFLGCPACLFNAGNKRRKEGAAGVDANFFDASNLDAKAQRERMAMETLDELLEWLHSQTQPESGCACGIFDATNTTQARREKVRQRIAREQPPVRLIFVESICDDMVVLENNYRMKLSNDDYKGIEPEDALRDFKERVRQYEAVYERVDDDLECRPLDEPSSPKSPGSPPVAVVAAEPPAAAASAVVSSADDTAAETAVEVSDSDALATTGGGKAAQWWGAPPAPGCIKLCDAGRKLVVTNCEGSYVISQLLSLLHSFSLAPRCIWLTTCGETLNDLKGILGGDSSLSPEGSNYAKAVRSHVLAREASEELRVGDAPPEQAMVLAGTLRRYKMMAEVLCAPEPPKDPPAADGASAAARKARLVLQLRGLNELCAGKLDSLSYEQMRELYPRERTAPLLRAAQHACRPRPHIDVLGHVAPLRLQASIRLVRQTSSTTATRVLAARATWT
jgi:broad specificity phosphatase PhoE